MHAIFSKRYEYQDSLTGNTRTVPAGWQGDLPEAVVQAAVAGGHALSPAATAAPEASTVEEMKGSARRAKA